MAAAAGRPILGMDIGGSQLRIGFVSHTGAILARTTAPTPDGGEPVHLAARLTRMLREFGTRYELADVAGAGIPGVWDRTTGVMQRAVNLHRLEGVNVRELLSEAVGRPVVLESDVNAAAWAQWRHVDPRPARFVYLSVGTGVGGAVVLDGQLVRHSRGGAGHLGHLIVEPDEDAPACRCGARGCLEAVAGGVSLGRRPDAAARQRAALGLALAILQIAIVYTPDVVALGGGVMESHADLLPAIRSAFSARASTLVPPELRIEAGTLRTDQAGVIGAALLAASTRARHA